MSHNLNSLKRVIWGIIYGIIIGDIKGDTRSLDCSSYVKDVEEAHLLPALRLRPFGFSHRRTGDLIGFTE